jgi:hypothetical protein
VLFWHNRPLGDGEGLFHSLELVLTAKTRYEVETPATMGGSASPSWDLKLTTM